jgi:hypothetical protein
MAEAQVDLSGVYTKIAQVRSEVATLRGELRQLEAWTQSEIGRLEREMIEAGKMIVGAIREQQAAVIAEFTATQALVGEGIVKTHDKLELQIESGLQLEIGKKLGDAEALRGKLISFGKEVKQRFNKSIENVALIRRAYDVNFRKIREEYASKIRQIGSHIFAVRDEDIAPSIESSKTSYEVAHGLPIEMDLRRIEVRSQNLDETLRMLRSSRLGEVLGCLGALESTVEQFSIRENTVGAVAELYVEGLATISVDAIKVVAGASAGPVSEGGSLALVTDSDFSGYSSTDVSRRIAAALSNAERSSPSDEELQRLRAVAANLAIRGLISPEADDLFARFLSSGSLRVLAQSHVG